MLKIDRKKEDLIQKIAQKYELRLLFLFGSRVSGQTHKESDFDFGYISSRDLSLDEEGQLILDLLPISEARDERLINLVGFKKAKPLLLRAALSNARLFYEREAGVFAELQNYAFKIYLETLPLFKLKAERMGAAVK